MEMIREYVHNQSIVIRPAESVLLNNVTLYDEIVDSIKKHDRRHVVFDFSGIELIDDCGIQAIVRVAERYSRKGYSFVIANPVKYVVKLLVEKDVIYRINVVFDKKNDDGMQNKNQ